MTSRPPAPAGPGAAGRPGLFGVYVHVPFCLTRCHYCDFVTYTGMEGLRRPYAAALLEEAALAVAALGPSRRGDQRVRRRRDPDPAAAGRPGPAARPAAGAAAVRVPGPR
jgi:hypothetical protein